MDEEFITKTIIRYLEKFKWNIFSFDYPQSGTGFLIHPNERNTKNKESIIPDIIANKNNYCIIMENKSYFQIDDFLKLYNLKNSRNYSNDLNKLMKNLEVDTFFYGVGLPNEADIMKNSLESMNYIDFLISVDNNKNCNKIINKNKNI
ncbi:MAG: hypothetical protein ACRCVG_03430 [Methanobacteriaceae archaeon]